MIGYAISEPLDVEPAQYFVVVTKREKRACQHCQEGGVAAAPAPERIVEKGLVSDRVVIDTVISKCCDHLPLYRQSVILAREAGVEIGRATLYGWVMRVGELAIPIVEWMRRELVGGSYIQADETPVDVQMPDGRVQNHQAYLWQCSRPGGNVVFDFLLGRGRESPQAFLGDFERLLQTDGYAAYVGMGGPRLVHACCWAHARRKFFEAHQLCPGESAAKGIVILIDQLFAVDGPGARAKLRLGRAGCAAPGASRAAAGYDPAGDRGGSRGGVARKQVGRRDRLHAGAVGETDALHGLSRDGTQHQPGGEFDAAGGY